MWSHTDIKTDGLFPFSPTNPLLCVCESVLKALCSSSSELVWWLNSDLQSQDLSVVAPARKFESALLLLYVQELIW